MSAESRLLKPHDVIVLSWHTPTTTLLQLRRTATNLPKTLTLTLTLTPALALTLTLTLAN